MSKVRPLPLADLTTEVLGLRLEARHALRRGSTTETTVAVFNGKPEPIAAFTGDLHSLDFVEARAMDTAIAAELAPTSETLSALESALAQLGRRVGPALTLAEAEAGVVQPLASSKEGDEDGRGARKSAATRCLEMCDTLELWHTPDQEPYTSFTVEEHRETWPINSTGFRRWLAAEFYRVEGQSLGNEARAEMLGVLSGRACFDKSSEERPAPVRLAHHEGAIFLDLADKEWRQVHITDWSWEVIGSNDSPIHFRRTKGMLALPEPVRGGSLTALRQLLNVATDDGWRLVAAWLVACLSQGPYPVLVFTGQQGTGKSTAGALLRAVLDPNKAPLRSAPREEEDLAIAASNGHIVALDNLSTLPDWLSDSLCRLSTGGGLGTRTLYTNDEETIFDYKRPCLLTSIEDVITRGDLLDRALLVELEPIPKPKRKAEVQIWKEMVAAAPGILGALLDATCTALANSATTHLAELPRMADFALWATAAETGMGWQAGAFMASYTANREDADDLALQGSIIASPVRALVTMHGAWSGTATVLLADLERVAVELARQGKPAAPDLPAEKLAEQSRRDLDAVRKQKGWPSKAHTLVGMLKRIAPQLRQAGITYRQERETTGKRAKLIHLDPMGSEDGGDEAVQAVQADRTRGEGRTGPDAASGPGAVPERSQIEEAVRDNGVLSSGAPSNGTAWTAWTAPLHLLSDPVQKRSGAYTLITDATTLCDAVGTLARCPLLGLDTETTGLDAHTDRLRLLQVATPASTYIIDTWQVPGWQEHIAPLLADPARTVIGHHLAFDLRFLHATGIEVDAACHDTYLGALLIDAGEHGLDRAYSFGLAGVAARALGVTLDKHEQKGDWGQAVLAPEQLHYAARDAAILHPLYRHQQTEIARWGLERVATIEMGCVPAMAWLAHAGMPFNTDAWADLSDAALGEQQRLEREILEVLTRELGSTGLFGYHVNLDSPVQVAKALAGLGVTVDATNEEALVAVRDRHPVVSMLLAYREASKRSGSFGIAWAGKYVHATTGCIHADYRQLGSRAGRMSCSNPNLQQIPRSKDYRACFRAAPGRALVKCDYAQIELRLAAAIAGDETMLAAYREGADLHTRTAAAVLGISELEVTKERRQLAKALNFGLIYGMGAPTLVQHAATGYGVRLTEAEAAAHRQRFFARYAGLRRWHNNTGRVPEAHDTRTLAGRRRASVARFTEKLNSPVQGSGADGLKAALGRLWQYRHEVMDTQLVAVVHDEVVAECPAGEAPAVAEWLRRHMVAGMAELVGDRVPIEVEATIAQDWAGTPLAAD